MSNLVFLAITANFPPTKYTLVLNICLNSINRHKHARRVRPQLEPTLLDSPVGYENKKNLIFFDKQLYKEPEGLFSCFVPV